MFVLDAINRNHSLAVSLLSSSKKGRAVSLLRGSHDKAKIGEKKAGHEVVQTFGDSNIHANFGRQFWKELPLWVEQRKIKPLNYRIVEGGLNVMGVNELLDDYRDGKNAGK